MAIISIDELEKQSIPSEKPSVIPIDKLEEQDIVAPSPSGGPQYDKDGKLIIPGMKEYMQGAQDLVDLSGQGLLKTATGKGFKERGFESQEQRIPQSKERPFNANVERARNPINQGVKILTQAYSGTMGEMADLVTSPLGLVEPGYQAVRGAAKYAGEKLAPILKKSAEASYTKALGPTTKGERALAEKVVPTMVERKPFVWTRGGLQRAAERNEDAAAKGLEEVYHTLPPESKISIKPIVENINKYQKELEVNGVVPEANLEKLNYLDKMKADLINVTHNKSVAPQTLREYRQVLDEAISESKQGFKMTGQGGPKLKAQRFLANSIRSEIAKKFPSIAKVNAEYSLWRNMTDLLETTVPKSKSPLSNMHGYVAEGINMSHPHIGVFLNLSKLVSDNAAWNTLAGSNKARIADFLAKGKEMKANSLIMSIMKKNNITPATGTSVIKNLEGTDLPGVGELSALPAVTKRPEHWVYSSQKEWPEVQGKANSLFNKAKENIKNKKSKKS